MNKRKRNCGSAGLGALLLASFISIFLAGWGATVEPPSRMQRMLPRADDTGCAAYSVKPHKKERWWGTGKQAGGIGRYSNFGKHESRPLTLDLPNIGLKDADEVVWPYGEEFAYEMAPFGHVSGEARLNNYRFDYTYKEKPSGGLLQETADISPFEDFKMTSESSIELDGEGKTSTAESLGRITVSEKFASGIETMELHTLLANHGGTTDFTIFLPEMEKYGSDIPHQITTTVDSPPDGFFFVSISSSPGYIAFLLSRVDWENYDRPKVWAPDFMGQVPYSVGFISFMRLTISRLDECPREVRDWWEESRADFGGWRPDDGTSVVVMDFKRPDTGKEEEVCYSWG
jgi:hypothetical protein